MVLVVECNKVIIIHRSEKLAFYLQIVIHRKEEENFINIQNCELCAFSSIFSSMNGNTDNVLIIQNTLLKFPRC